VYSNSVQAQRNKKKELAKVEQISEEPQLSSTGFPYIEKFHQGIREKMAGNLSESKKLFKECIEIRDDNDAVYFALAEIAVKERNSIQAIQYYQKANELDPKNLVYIQELAYLYLSRSNFLEAQKLFEEMVTHEPRNIDFRYGYVKVLIYNKEYEKAIQQIDKMEELVGVSPELSNMKADLFLELGKENKAEETLLQLKNEYPDDLDVLKMVMGFYDQKGDKEKAYQMVKELTEKDPDNGIARLILAYNYYEKGQYDAFLEITPPLFYKDDITLDQKLMLFGMLTETAEDTIIYRISEYLYNMNPDDFNVSLEYGITLEAQGQSKEALTVLRKNLNSKIDIMNWLRVLEFERSHKDYKQLYEDGSRAMTIFPSIPDVYYYATIGAIETGRIDEAIGILSSGELYVLDDKISKTEFTSLRGRIFFKQKDYKKGIIEYEKAISYAKTAPQRNKERLMSEVKINYALDLVEANITNEIAKELLSEIPANYRSPNFFIAISLYQKNKNNLEEGISFLLDVLENDILYNADLYDVLGDLYFENNQPTEAVKSWQVAFDRGSRNQVLSKKINEKKHYAPKYY